VASVAVQVEDKEEDYAKVLQVLDAERARVVEATKGSYTYETLPYTTEGVEYMMQHAPMARSYAPSVIVGGIADSLTDTLVMRFFLESIGVKMCRDLVRVPTPIRNQAVVAFVKKLLQESEGVITMQEFTRAPRSFISLVQELVRSVREAKQCVLAGSGELWGYRDTRAPLFLPAIGAAFGRIPKVILVTRDPRDICQSTNLEQYKSYCPAMLGKAQCNMRDDCYAFWAKFHHNILDNYKGHQSVCVVRLEDLVSNPYMDDSPSPKIVLRIIKDLGGEITRQATQDLLFEMHKFNSTYSQGLSSLYDTMDASEETIQDEIDNFRDPSLKSAMRSFGYDFTRKRTVRPTSSMMC